MRVAIVGGGASGLVTARILRAFGHDVVLHEKAADLGGVWSASRRYPGISTQDDRRTYSFSDFPMPSDLPEHPSGADVRRYFESYATAHRLDEIIRLGSEVVSVEPDGAGWRVSARSGDRTSDETVDLVVIANGVFSDPHVPAWPGQDAFEAAGGAIVQPSRLGDGERLRGRDVVVIGWGKTACDLAASASTLASSAAIVARAVRWKHPKRIGRHLTFRHLLMTRTGEHLLAPQHRSLPGRVLARLDRPLRDAVDRWLAARVAAQLRLDELGLRPNGPYSDSSALVSEGFYEAVAEQRLTVHREQVVTELGAEHGRPVARLSGGETLPVDVLVPATGYEQRLEPLSAEVQRELLAAGTLLLHRGILPKTSGLAFIGWSHTFHSPLRSELQALWLAAHLADGVPTSSRDESEYHLTHERAVERRAQQLPGATFGDLDRLLDDIGLPEPRSLRLRQLVRPIDPADYAWVLPRLLRRAGRVDDPSGPADAPSDPRVAQQV